MVFIFIALVLVVVSYMMEVRRALQQINKESESIQTWLQQAEDIHNGKTIGKTFLEFLNELE